MGEQQKTKWLIEWEATDQKRSFANWMIDKAEALEDRLEQYEAEAQDKSDPQVRPMTMIEHALMDAQGENGRLAGVLGRIAGDHNDGRAFTGETAKLYREWCTEALDGS